MSDDKYQNKYRIPSARAVWHNYNGGVYYVTICTRDRVEYFGEIGTDESGNAKMKLSEVGKIAEDCIAKMESLHDDITVPLWVVMPNHIHLVVIVDSPPVETPYYDVSTTDNNNQTDTMKNEKMQEIANSCGRLSHVISRFKTAVTKYAHENNIPVAWQTRFHDRIVRNVDELNGISAYIENNIAKWAFDELNDNNVETPYYDVSTQNETN